MQKLIATELTEETIQLTYTDGQIMGQSKEFVTFRLSFDGDLTYSILWNQMRAVEALQTWANAEYRRLRKEVEKH
jgi:hypothetical protein